MGLKSKVASGMLWSFAERFGAQAVSFIVSIILARLIAPEAYGAIALVLVFINIANVFATGAFGNALIQKKDADNVDFSTVFYFSIVFSVALYAVIFLCSPLVSRFYGMQELTPVLRVLGVRIIIASVNSVQGAYISRQMLFKHFFFATLGGTVVSAIVGILLAYKGFGVWALVCQYMINSTIDTVVLWVTVKWRPDKVFSFDRLKDLFSYGWKLLCSSLLSTVYTELTDMVVGKVYGAADLAYYNKGKKFPHLFVAQVDSAIKSVLFPAMSKHQDSTERLKEDVRYSVRFGSFLIFPMVFGMAVTARDLIILLLGETWKESVAFLQIACISYAILPVGLANIQAIKAMGRSDLYLRLDVIKKVIGVSLLLVFVRRGVMAIAIAETVSNVFGLVINVYPNKKLLNYRATEVMRDVMPSLALTAIMCLGTYCVGILPFPVALRFVLQIAVGFVIYFGTAYLLKIRIFMEAVYLAKSSIMKR